MKEIIAVIRMNKVGPTKKALVEAGVAGFTALKAIGRGKVVKNIEIIADRKKQLLAKTNPEDPKAEQVAMEFLDGRGLFPCRMFTILAHDEQVQIIVQAIIKVNKTQHNVGDGKIFILPLLDAVRVRTNEHGDAAI